jgi:hypothetical protein
MEQEIGRIKKSEKKEIVVRVDEYKGEKGVTIREWVHGKKFDGFTKSGTRIPFVKWIEFKELVNRV